MFVSLKLFVFVLFIALISAAPQYYNGQYYGSGNGLGGMQYPLGDPYGNLGTRSSKIFSWQSQYLENND